MIKTINLINKAGVKTHLGVPSNKNAFIKNNIRNLGSIFISDSNKSLGLYQKDIDIDYELKYGDKVILTGGDFYIYHRNAGYKGTVALEYSETSTGGQNFTGGIVPVTINIEDSLTSNATTDALSANMGRVLNENKVDKENGKGLSTEDYTNAEKSKLATVEQNANNYVLPIASDVTVGGSKYNSNDFEVDASGLVTLKSKSIDSLNDIDISTNPPTNGQLLAWNGTEFVPVTFNGNTDLSLSNITSDNFTIVSSNGSDVVIPKATTSQAGLMSGSDKTKLDAIEPNANNYTHPIGDGNLHIPANGTTNAGKVLMASATAGVYTWEVLPTSSNMYNTDGILTNDRTVTTNSHDFEIEDTNSRFRLNDSFVDIEANDNLNNYGRIRVDVNGSVYLIADNGLYIGSTTSSTVGSNGEVLTSKGSSASPVWEAITIANNNIDTLEANSDWNNA